jgi:hypothetical protein
MAFLLLVATFQRDTCPVEAASNPSTTMSPVSGVLLIANVPFPKGSYVCHGVSSGLTSKRTRVSSTSRTPVI